MNSISRRLRQFRLFAVFTAMLSGGMAVIVPALANSASPQTASPAIANTLVANNSAISDLAKHLQKIGVKMYGAYWCPHCKHQKDLFGDRAFRSITYIECDPKGENAKPNLCKAANIKGYPTWEIKGKLYPGTQSLEDLAKLSEYKGSTKF